MTTWYFLSWTEPQRTHAHTQLLGERRLVRLPWFGRLWPNARRQCPRRRPRCHSPAGPRLARRCWSPPSRPSSAAPRSLHSSQVVRCVYVFVFKIYIYINSCQYQDSSLLQYLHRQVDAKNVNINVNVICVKVIINRTVLSGGQGCLEPRP